MLQGCVRRLSPVVQQIVDAPLVQRRVHPVGEGDDVGRRRRILLLRTRSAEIVGETAGADHQHILLTQRSDRAAELQMVRRAELALQRELQDGDVMAGIHQRQRHPRSVVQAALVIDLHRQAALAQQSGNLLGQFR